MARPFAVGLHHRRNKHRRDASPPVARLHFDLLVQGSLDGKAAVGGEELGVAAVAELAEHVVGGGRVGGGMAVADAQQCRVFDQNRFAAGNRKRVFQVPTGMSRPVFCNLLLVAL